MTDAGGMGSNRPLTARAQASRRPSTEPRLAALNQALPPRNTATIKWATGAKRRPEVTTTAFPPPAVSRRERADIEHVTKVAHGRGFRHSCPRESSTEEGGCTPNPVLRATTGLQRDPENTVQPPPTRVRAYPQFALLYLHQWRNPTLPHPHRPGPSLLLEELGQARLLRGSTMHGGSQADFWLT